MSFTREDIDAAHDAIKGGESIEDIAANGGVPEEGEQLELLHLGDKLDTSIGGGKPDTSKVKVRSISVPVRGQLRMGETLTLMVTVRVGEVAFVDKFDGDGRAVGRERRHTTTPVSVITVSEEQANGLLGLESD